MDTKSELREFLTSRRAKLTPEQAGLRTYGTGQRRVPGLRREEVALLAGVSVDYYTRLERGNAAGVSDTVLEALARALQLDGTERDHLFDLARATTSPRRSRRRSRHDVRPAVQHMIDAMTGVPAFVRNGRLDILGANRLGRALYSEHLDSRAAVEYGPLVFLDPLHELLQGLGPRRRRCRGGPARGGGARPVRPRALRPGRGAVDAQRALPNALGGARRTHPRHRHKRVRHPLVGELDLSFEAMELVADPGLTMFVYTAEPGSRSEQALSLLASWSATPDEETTDADHEEQPRHGHRA